MADGCRDSGSASAGVTIDDPARDCTKACGVVGQGPDGMDRNSFPDRLICCVLFTMMGSGSGCISWPAAVSLDRCESTLSPMMHCPLAAAAKQLRANRTRPGRALSPPPICLNRLSPARSHVLLGLSADRPGLQRAQGRRARNELAAHEQPPGITNCRP